MLRLTVALGALVGALVVMPMNSVGAAELQTPRAALPANCGPCGCLQVAYVYHRDLLTTYGTGFDPRNYDTTQPHYYFSRSVHAYPRYSVDGALLPDQCPVE
jgi:hypothetical protein